ncbi:Outer membrane protein TolC [Desulforhopalus singaporensis]|uniref:Outer membrane protein TolC n=2 Tax=Desulforhopalus singaporensis TaxID=91360 RepID=A0A1H0K054_9BACT|nr:Outer membrane protein TolC [Desulforhopalus singaporensis]
MSRLAKIITICCLLSILSLHESRGGTLSSDRMTILESLEIALANSDMALDLKDRIRLSEMDVESAEHRFDTKVVPLTSFGVTQGIGAQQVGIEMRRETDIGASVAYGIVGNSIDEGSDYVIENSKNAKAYVRVAQGILRRWGKQYNRSDVTRAELDNELETIRGERDRQTIILNTIQSFYDLVLAEQLLETAQKSLSRSQAHLEMAGSRQEVGLVSKIDVYRAEMAVFDAESDVERRQRQLQTARDNYRDILGLSDDTNIAVDNRISKVSPVMPEQWEDQLLEKRYDWQAHLVEIDKQQEELSRLRRNLLPDVGLSFTVEQKGSGDSADEVLELDITNWSVQLQLLSSLDTLSEEQALVRGRMVSNKLRRQGSRLKNRIYREARRAIEDYYSEQREVRLSGMKQEQAEAALELARSRYEKGLGSNLDVIDAQSEYSNAEITSLRSLVAANIAAFKVAYSLGTLNRQWVSLALATEELAGESN